LDQRKYVMPIQFDTDTLIKRDGVGLMRGLVEHRRESEEVSTGRLIEDDVLLIFVNGSDLDSPRDQHVCGAGWVSNLVDPLSRQECAELDLRRQHLQLIVVE